MYKLSLFESHYSFLYQWHHHPKPIKREHENDVILLVFNENVPFTFY